MKLINKTGIEDIKRKLDECYDTDLIEYTSMGINEQKPITIDHSFRDNRNTWTRSTVYLRKSRSGNLIIEW